MQGLSSFFYTTFSFDLSKDLLKIIVMKKKIHWEKLKSLKKGEIKKNIGNEWCEKRVGMFRCFWLSLVTDHCPFYFAGNSIATSP